jgi:hypothetical protein
VADIGQTFPPVAVLALAVPAVGFGLKPVLIALVLYGLLPIFESTIAGIEDVPRDIVEAARGMGMNGWQQLVSIELPLAFPVIVNGVRLAVVINLGTATIGSTVAARGLGDVIIAGLQTSNTAFVLQGGVIVGLLAVLVSDAIGALRVAGGRRGSGTAFNLTSRHRSASFATFWFRSRCEFLEPKRTARCRRLRPWVSHRAEPQSVFAILAEPVDHTAYIASGPTWIGISPTISIV